VFGGAKPHQTHTQNNKKKHRQESLATTAKPRELDHFSDSKSIVLGLESD
jgi:hypothetical protein